MKTELPYRLKEHFRDERELYCLEGPINILGGCLQQGLDCVETLDVLNDLNDTMIAYMSKMHPYIEKLQDVKMKRLLNQVTEEEQINIDFVLEEGGGIKWVKS